MSSMWRAAVLLPRAAGHRAFELGAICGARDAMPLRRLAAPSVGIVDRDWRTLRQSSGYRFTDYASFLIANPDWPEETHAQLGREGDAARARMRRPCSPFSPTQAGHRQRLGSTRRRLCRNRSHRRSARRGAARLAAADLSATDEQAIWKRYGSSFTRADNDERVDALLFAKKPDDAARFLTATSPERQAASRRGSRCSSDAADADSRYQAVIGQRHRRRRADDGSCALASREQLSGGRAAARRPRSQLHLSGRRIRNASSTC